MDGKELAPLGDFDEDGLVSVLDPDSDNDGLKDGLDLAAAFQANTSSNNANSGGGAGNGVSGGAGGVCDNGEEGCVVWRTDHPKRFITYEKEVVSGKLTGQVPFQIDNCGGCGVPGTANHPVKIPLEAILRMAINTSPPFNN